MKKNVSGQKIAVYAWDASNNVPKTGDAANITAEISLDGAASAPVADTNPTELDAADHPGVYLFDPSQAESNADLVVVSPVSSTADIHLEPVILYPEDPAHIYTAEIHYMLDEVAGQDEYAVLWYRDGVEQNPGAVTLTVRQRADGTVVVNGKAMTQPGGTTFWKYDASGGERAPDGESLVIVVSATIDGAVRTWSRIVSRDTSS